MPTVNQLAKRSAASRHRAILDGAKSVFLEHGFGGASMDEVALAASVSKMTVYRYFASKEELFAGVITDLCDRIVVDNLEVASQQPPEQALAAFARDLVAIIFAPETIELHRIVVAESRRFPALGKFFYESGPQGCIDVLAAYLQRNRDHPDLAIDDPREAAQEFLDLLRGYPHLRLLLGLDTVPARDEIEKRVAAAMRHLVRSPR
jgi:TetR/AcrR family transcriptional regulator, mexJK operon transcriptional repressor